MLFELLGLMEYYHPRMQLRLQLARIMILNLLNLYSLIWALFGKINGMTERLTQIKSSQELSTTTTAFESPFVTSANAPDIQTSFTSSGTTTEMTSTILPTTTEGILTKIAKIINETLHNMTTTEFPHNDPTENYDYSNSNYFEVDEISSPNYSTPHETTSMDPFGNEPFYIDTDPGNISFAFFTNTTGNLFENFNMSNLMNSTDFNDSLAYNYTDTEPQYDNFQYSFLHQESPTFINMDLLNTSTKLELRKLCWETMFGQELVKLTVMDLVKFFYCK